MSFTFGSRKGECWWGWGEEQGQQGPVTEAGLRPWERRCYNINCILRARGLTEVREE